MVSDPRQIIDIQIYAHNVIFQHAFCCLLMDGLFIKEVYSSAQERLKAWRFKDWALLKRLYDSSTF